MSCTDYAELTATVDRLLKERYSARYYLPDPVDKPWKVYCIAGSVRDAISAEMVAADKSKVPYKARYDYFPPVLPAEHAARKFDFGQLSLARWDEFFDAPVALIFTIHGELVQGSWMDLGHPMARMASAQAGYFMQSVTIGLRARGLEPVTQLSIPQYDDIIRKHLKTIPDTHIVACGMALGYPDLEKVKENYVFPKKLQLGEVLEVHGM
ncbi:nitroreductase [Roridomyces roridus]|uniref:Nitroreductase n=1 Tax=Roridomyces roridus TaxID=1738132 RepID=A0AAD7FA95_9AGAR|nr:nitroreductase [Roridomyces roridus]